MLLIADANNYYTSVVPFYSLDGMTLLIGAFFFYCLAHPQRVRHRTAFWGVFGCLLVITLMYALRMMFYNSPGGQVFTGVCTGLLQIAGLVLTALYVGGLRVSDVAEELRDAAVDFRHSADAVRAGGSPGVRPPHEQPAGGAAAAPAAPAVANEPPRVMIELPKTPSDEKIPLA